MGFHLRMNPEDAAGLLAACERAAEREQGTREQAHRAAQQTVGTKTPPGAAPGEPVPDGTDEALRQRLVAGGALVFPLVPPAPLIDDGVDYIGPDSPNPWLDGDRVRRDEPGWRVVGRQRGPR